MNARFIAASCGTILAAVACAAGAQSIEITSPSIGTVTVHPQPIAKRTATPAAKRAARSDGRSSGVDLGIRRNPDGSLYDALDPRQNRAAASAQPTPQPSTPAAQPYDVANAGSGVPADAMEGSARANRAVVPGQGTTADFPNGLNGAAR